MNYGTLVMVGGHVHRPQGPTPSPAPDARLRGGLVRMGGALAPPAQEFVDPSKASFVVELNYSDRAFRLSERNGRFSSDMSVSYSKQFKRLASGGNPLKAAKDFVAQFAGCDEAHKLRKRVIALAKIRKTVDGEVFRFPVEDP